MTQWVNSERSYGWLAIALHWAAVLAIALMLITGFRADFLGEAGDRAGRAEVMGWHVSIGATVFLILLARVASSYAQRKPAPYAQSKPLMRLAEVTHHVLLLAILVQIISGPLAVWSGGRPINVFDAFALPSPFASRNEAAHEFAELLHAMGRWTIVVAGGLHIGAVVMHALQRHNVLGRMLRPL